MAIQFHGCISERKMAAHVATPDTNSAVMATRSSVGFRRCGFAIDAYCQQLI